MELTEDGTDYLVRSDVAADEFTQTMGRHPCHADGIGCRVPIQDGPQRRQAGAGAAFYL